MNFKFIKFFACSFMVSSVLMLSSCADLNPHNTNVVLPESKPREKVTTYSNALTELGLMTLIYDQGQVNIQSQDIYDETGASKSTGAEIQKNITEIMKSTLNSIGGQVTFIEYNPSFIQNQVVTGYSSFDNKLIPDVVITGGITEFDRALETKGTGTNLDAEFQATGLPTWVPGDSVGVGVGANQKAGKARITLDFNMKDFQTLAGIPYMTTSNSMEVYKGLNEKELGITFFGPTFGLKGSSKKVQGRHEAVRMLVQMSMIQMVGKYLNLPYWKLLGEDALPDPVVLNSLRKFYHGLNAIQKVFYTQQWLILHGYNIDLTGQVDAVTKTALKDFDATFDMSASAISEDLFIRVYNSIPVGYETLSRRGLLNNMIAELFSPEESTEDQRVSESPPPAEETLAEVEIEANTPDTVETVPQQTEQVIDETNKPLAKAVKTQPASSRSNGLGRKLSDSEW